MPEIARDTCERRCGQIAMVAAVAIMLAACADNGPRRVGVPDQIDYNWHVRPILSENCFQCHGNDPSSLEAGLRLDTPESAFAELRDWAGHHAIVPGDSGASELISRITAANEEDRMPPPATRKTLSAVEIEILRQWIDDGAEYKRHWAFITPARLAVPDDASIFRAAEAPESGTRSAAQSNAAVDAAAAYESVLAEASAIDRFVYRRLADEGLPPSARADRETLINRVSLTLTGLPPTLAEVDAFVADESPDAWERVVERLLDSPRYAEHMAGFWMDLARYSESDGFLDDHHDRTFWPYRDWVIAAFASNMPFDQFGTWQLAGDLLPDATREQILSTAFVRVGKRTTENGAIDEEYKAEYMVERTDNALGVAFLGLTVGCARCHDHKYDPISQRDYYSLGAFFNSTDEPGHYAPGFSGIQGGPTLPWPDVQAAADIERAEAAMLSAEAAFSAARALAREDAEREAGRLAAGPRDAFVTRVADSLERALAAHYPFESAAAARVRDLPAPRPQRQPPPALTALPRNPYLGPPPPPAETEEQRRQRAAAELVARIPRNYVVEELTLSPAATAGTPPAVIQDPEFRAGVVGNALYFNETNKGFLGRDVGYYDRGDPFSLDFWFYAAAEYDDVPVLNHMAENNSGRTGYRISVVDGRLWVQLAHSPPANMIGLESLEPFPVGEWTHVTLTYDGSSRAAGTKVYLNGAQAAMRVDHDSLTRTMLPWTSGDVFDPFLGLVFGTRFRVKAPVGGALDELRVFDRALNPLEVAFLDDSEQFGADVPGPDRDDLTDLLVANNPAVVAAAAALQSARRAHNELVSAVPQVLVMGDAPQPIPTYVLNRGVYNQPGERVEPRGLEAAFPWDESLPANRLGLARWLFDPAHPLTARVFVNRIWQLHFGRGLVETAEDFGAQGSIPSHPDLLDWLAVEFVESGWDVRALNKRIVMSSTYRQSSDVGAELAKRDPGNELLARGPRWRMTAEMVRDHALAVSGLLTDRIGGESVLPYQAAGIWNPLNAFYPYPEAAGLDPDAHHRRTLYTFVKRNALHPTLEIFDFRPRTESIARRRRASTPLQALVMINDPQYVEAYRALAQRALEDPAGNIGPGATRVRATGAGAPDHAAALTQLFRMATRRAPTAAELEVLERYHAGQLDTFLADPAKAERLLGVGVVAADPRLDRVALAAMTQAAALVMNSPDAYTVR